MNTLQVDATADGYIWLSDNKEIPVFAIPDMSSESRFSGLFK